MKATLIVPGTLNVHGCGKGVMVRLTWEPAGPGRSDGAGVMCLPWDEALAAVEFRMLRKVYGAFIQTDQPSKVCVALGVPEGEPGIIEPWSG